MSFEFAWLEGFNFIWIFLVWSNQFQMNKWNCQSSYELLCLEMPNFDMNFSCISLIGNSKFYMDFPLWKYPISHQHMKFIVWTFKFIEFDAMVYKSSVLPLRVFFDSLIQGVIFKQGAKIMQPLQDAGCHMYIYIYIYSIYIL